MNTIIITVNVLIRVARMSLLVSRTFGNPDRHACLIQIQITFGVKFQPSTFRKWQKAHEDLWNIYKTFYYFILFNILLLKISFSCSKLFFFYFTLVSSYVYFLSDVWRLWGSSLSDFYLRWWGRGWYEYVTKGSWKKKQTKFIL